MDLYHHNDGYIEGIGFDLIKRFYNFDKQKFGITGENLDDIVNQLIKDTEDEYQLTIYNHCDIEYLYEIDVNNNRLTAYSVNNWNSKIKKMIEYTQEEIVNKYLKSTERSVTMGKATKEQKAAIHIIKNKYNISDDNYRELIFNNFSVFSSVDLTEEETEKFMHILNMEYAKDYRNGYNHAMEFLKDILALNNTEVFKNIIKKVCGRSTNNLELELFNTLSTDKQLEFLRKYM